jgi:HSP20 family protein
MSDGLVRWEPLRDLVTLREAMDRLFAESFVRPSTAYAAFGMEGPAVDIYQTKDEIVVKAAIPGVKPEDIDISVTGDVLTIKGKLEEEEKIEEANYLRQERRYGEFHREFSLPTQVSADKAKAEFEHGVLTLHLPKAEEVKPKSIKVKAK